MKLYGRTTSFNVQKVLWLLEELNIDYQHIQLGGRFNGLDDPEFVKLNPMRKVPVLVDGEKAIWESHSILRYLVASFADESWYSADPYQRSLYERWMDWSQLIFQNAFMGTFWGYYRMSEAKRDMKTVNAELEKCVQCLSVLDKQLSLSDYLAGESITLADICAGAIIYRLTTQGLSISLPIHVARWYEKLKTRPGYQKWVMSDYSELKAREDY